MAALTGRANLCHREPIPISLYHNVQKACKRAECMSADCNGAVQRHTIESSELLVCCNEDVAYHVSSPCNLL